MTSMFTEFFCQIQFDLTTSTEDLDV